MIRIRKSAIVKIDRIRGKMSAGRTSANAPYAPNRESSKKTDLKASFFESPKTKGLVIRIKLGDQKNTALPIGSLRISRFSRKKATQKRTPTRPSVVPVLCRRYACDLDFMFYHPCSCNILASIIVMKKQISKSMFAIAHDFMPLLPFSFF
jgi:hypothetical protein